ncbi:MAG: sulfotransferase [Thermoplasmata archaeon]
MMASSSPSRMTLVQVISSPHSGSTILGVILGSAPGIYYGGEMDRVPVPVWQTGLLCSCGVPTADCPFWGSVRTRFEATHDTSRLVKGQRRFEPWYSLRRALVATVFHTGALRSHARETAALLRIIAETSEKPMVIDSSKFAGRALVYAAARSEAFDVRYIHVVRDGRAVIASRKARWSAKGTDTESAQFATWSALRWVIANLAFSVLFSWRRGRYLRLRHEDFVRDPEGTLRRLEQFLGVSLATPLAKLREGSAFPVVHVPTGNRIRLAGEVRFRRGPAGRPAAIPEVQRRAFWRAAGVLARLYGYEKTPRPVESPTPATPPSG